MFSGTSLTAGAMFGNTLTAAAKDAFTGMLSGVNGQSEYTYTMEYGTDLSNRSCFTS